MGEHTAETDAGCWQVIPEAEMPLVLDAVKNGGCVVCYEPTEPGHFLYCHAHDDGCGDECVIPPASSAQPDEDGGGDECVIPPESSTR